MKRFIFGLFCATASLFGANGRLSHRVLLLSRVCRITMDLRRLSERFEYTLVVTQDTPSPPAGQLAGSSGIAYGRPPGSQKDAENLLKQRLGDVAAGRHVGPEKATIDDLCSLVIADYQFRGLRSTKVVEWRYEANAKPILGSLPAARFGPQHVRLYVDKRRQAGTPNSTINRELAIVRRGFRLGALEDPPLVHRRPAIPGLEEDNARQGQGFIEGNSTRRSCTYRRT